MRRNVWIPDDLWKRAEQAALRVSVMEGKRVTMSELVRRGLEAQVKAAERKGAKNG